MLFLTLRHAPRISVVHRPDPRPGDRYRVRDGVLGVRFRRRSKRRRRQRRRRSIGPFRFSAASRSREHGSFRGVRASISRDIIESRSTGSARGNGRPSGPSRTLRLQSGRRYGSGSEGRFRIVFENGTGGISHLQQSSPFVRVQRVGMRRASNVRDGSGYSQRIDPESRRHEVVRRREGYGDRARLRRRERSRGGEREDGIRQHRGHGILSQDGGIAFRRRRYRFPRRRQAVLLLLLLRVRRRPVRV
mmetsp:Transcript_19246/g.56079  ORF Transcript_19246/g.56079 Transcript_19246/m.56079 type:complete len:247 (+) Transcript_19246:518-1258(+)